MVTSTLFHLAPPVTVVDGLTAVPIDISHLDAEVTFDLATQTASVDATMSFVMGPSDGNPIFDLRQDIDQATLDGMAIAASTIAHHDFGGGPGADLRIVESVLAAGSSHQLRLVYTLGTPNAFDANQIEWAGSRLSFDFWFSDLYPGRYLEMWLPANLVFDQFSIHLGLRLMGTAVDHVPITTGSTTTVDTNHWHIDFPEVSTACSPMLVVKASDRVESREGTLTIPGGTISLRTFRDLSTTANLASVENDVGTFLQDNISNVGPYAHGDSFTTYIWSSSRAMEYAGGTTSNLGALQHEIFHSWFARGVLPGSQNDGWLDEAFTVWNTGSNAFSALPLDLGLSVSELSPRNPFSRVTPGDSYSRGTRVFSGIAADVGIATLSSLMSEIYERYVGTALTTEQLEEELITRTGSTRIADYFQRYVYGRVDSTFGGGPNLYIRDAPDDPGFDEYTGSRFWDSPDLWVRNDYDDGIEHQNPEAGQDNWIHARVRNRGATTGRHFVVTFNIAQFAGTQFVFPNDYLPPINTTSEFDLAPGDSKHVVCRWPRADVPSAGTHACLLASVYATSDAPIDGYRVWEHNNLAQKNLTVVDLQPNDTYVLYAQLGSIWNLVEREYVIELQRPPRYPRLSVSLEHSQPRILERFMADPGARAHKQSVSEFVTGSARFLDSTRIAPGMSALKFALAAESAIEWVASPTAGPNARPLARRAAGINAIRDPGGRPLRLEFLPGRLVHVPFNLHPREALSVGLRVRVPRHAKTGEILNLDLLQRTGDCVCGGVSLRIRVKGPQ